MSTPPLSNICCFVILALGLGEWLFHTIIRAITTKSVWVCVCVTSCVCFLLQRGGAGWTNMSFWVSGCRANIDQSALRHVAGQIKHSSSTKNQWHALSPGWISLRLSDWSPTHHTGKEIERSNSSLCCFSEILTLDFRFFFLSFSPPLFPKNTVICKVY